MTGGDPGASATRRPVTSASGTGFEPASFDPEDFGPAEPGSPASHAAAPDPPSPDPPSPDPPMSDPPAFDPAAFDPAALRAGHALVAADRDRFAARFFEILFARYPDLHRLFPDDLAWAGTAVTAVVEAVVSAADDAEALLELVETFGVDNRTVGFLDEDYARIGHAMVLTARSVGGSAWTPDVDRAWVDGFDVVAELMVGSATRDWARGPRRLSGQVVEHVRRTPDLAVLRVRLDEAILARPGQHVLVSAPDLPGVWRPYHVVPVPADAHEVELYVRSRRPDGVAATLVRTGVGAPVYVGRPQGADLLGTVGDQNLLMVAVGTGIAPVLALVADPGLAQGGRRVHVFYGGRTVDDLAALDRLESIRRRFPRLDIVPVVTTSGGEERLARTMAGIVESFADWRRHRVVVAGATATVRPTLDQLRSLGVTDDQIVRADRRAP